jgi:hypothetical protein
MGPQTDVVGGASRANRMPNEPIKIRTNRWVSASCYVARRTGSVVGSMTVVSRFLWSLGRSICRSAERPVCRFQYATIEAVVLTTCFPFGSRPLSESWNVVPRVKRRGFTAEPDRTGPGRAGPLRARSGTFERRGGAISVDSVSARRDGPVRPRTVPLPRGAAVRR